MTPADFLNAVWPTAGFYCLATPYVTPSGHRTYVHKTFDTIANASAFVEKYKLKQNIFFAVHSLHEREVWNPTKVNQKTGELGAFEIRTQANAQESRAFFFDLDVGTSTPALQKYASQQDAATDLIRFCKETHLPKPLVTSSGGGLHVYWLVSDSLPSTEWRAHASKLRQLAKHHGLRADPARTTDTASVLRVAGTFNLKDVLNPRPVQVLIPGKTTPTGEFLKMVSDAVVRAGVTVKAPLNLLPDTPAGLAALGSNISTSFNSTPVSFKALVSACAQVQRQVRLKGNVSEPEWFHTLNLIRFCENGDEIAHKYSQGYPGYTKEGTDAKLAQLKAKRNANGEPLGPTTCFKLAEVAGDEACEGCPFATRPVGSPLVGARMKDPAPAPVIQHQVGNVVHTTTIPDAPRPFTRMKDGGISILAKNKDGDEVHTVIYPYDIHPIRRLVNSVAETEQQMWRVVFPREGAKEFTLDADALYDKKKFNSTIANHGIYPQANLVTYLQDYMIAYIAELQRLTDAEAQCNHLGWIDEQTKFIMPDRIMLEDGTAKPAMLSLHASRASAAIHKKGTLEKQVELLRFYDHAAYIPQQFLILCGLAAPLFYATGQHGVIVNATGETGASKSTSLYTAASMWGDPEIYTINGTAHGATAKARSERVAVLANLPVCVDEITHIPVKDAIDLAMSITQPGHKLTLTSDRVERAASGAYKATMMLTSANASLHGLLSTDNAAGTAGSMRVFEINMKKNLIHSKAQADDYLHDLKKNYGHVGELVMSYVVQNKALVEERVRVVLREIDNAGHVQPAERFWSAAIACTLVACEIANLLGVVTYNAAVLRDWCVNRQIPHMRGVVGEEYTNPVGLLADYLEHISGDMLVARNHAGNVPTVTRAPRGQLLAHYDLDNHCMYVLKKGFKDYCVRQGANFLKILDDLSMNQLDRTGKMTRVISSKHIKKTLGAGTDYAKAQSWCFVINMTHPEITGSVDLSVVHPQPNPPARPNLKLV